MYLLCFPALKTVFPAICSIYPAFYLSSVKPLYPFYLLAFLWLCSDYAWAIFPNLFPNFYRRYFSTFSDTIFWCSFRGSILGSWCVALSGNAFLLHSNIFLIVNNPPVYKACVSCYHTSLYIRSLSSSSSSVIFFWKSLLFFLYAFFMPFLIQNFLPYNSILFPALIGFIFGINK